jgi:hypothetical protein
MPRSGENAGFENDYQSFAQEVFHCVTTIWLTPVQINDIFRIKNENKFDNVVIEDIEIVLENLYDEGEIIKDDNPKLGLRYKLKGENNILPFTRKAVAA